MKKLLYALSFAALYVAAANAVSTQSVTDSVASTLPSITAPSITSEVPVSNDSDDNSATTKANLEVAVLSSSSDDSEE